MAEFFEDGVFFLFVGADGAVFGVEVEDVLSGEGAGGPVGAVVSAELESAGVYPQLWYQFLS